jgi:hypothetical protein
LRSAGDLARIDVPGLSGRGSFCGRPFEAAQAAESFEGA